MQAIRLTWIVLSLILGGTVRLAAQQDDASRKFFEESKAKAENGDAEAQFNLGFCYFSGKGVQMDLAEALQWYRKAADQGHALAQVRVGACYEWGMGVSRDETEVVKWYRKAADQGNALAQSSLGYCYQVGRGVTKDLVEAVKWYRRSAEQGHAFSQVNLGFCYERGYGVRKNYAEAVKWYRKAADQGDARGQFFLGCCYRFGNGVRKNEAKAVEWFRKSADQGNDGAQHLLGGCYETGSGVIKDLGEATKWYRKAAEQDNALAQVILGYCYQSGSGVLKDYVEAVKWYRRAADKGDAQALWRLGCCYYLGLGVPQDYVEAHKWSNLSSSQGEQRGRDLMNMVEREMTGEQIAEAQRLAREFKPRQVPVASTDAQREFAPELRPFGSGTGFFITEDGFLVTSEHVVKKAAQIRLVTSGGLIAAKVVKVDTANDLALLKAEGSHMPLPVAASRGARLGSTVATVGFPNVGLQGFAPKLAKGEIGALSGPQDDPRYFQISVPVQPGNSGGALVDERGNVVGVVTAKLDARAALAVSGTLPENVNYAVKSSFLLSFLESVPQVASKIKDAVATDRKFEDVVRSAEQAAVLVLVY